MAGRGLPQKSLSPKSNFNSLKQRARTPYPILTTKVAKRTLRTRAFKAREKSHKMPWELIIQMEKLKTRLCRLPRSIAKRALIISTRMLASRHPSSKS